MQDQEDQELEICGDVEREIQKLPKVSRKTTNMLSVHHYQPCSGQIVWTCMKGVK